MSDAKISEARIAAAQERIDAYHPQPAELADLYRHLLDMLGAKDHEDAGRIIGELHGKSLNRTCPSGDGSLRWPCPKHPPESAEMAGQQGDALAAFNECLTPALRVPETVAYRIAVLAAVQAETGKQQVGDDGLPLVCVTQEFKNQADYDAEISSAASNLLRNNTLGLSGSLPEMVAALLKLASEQQVGEVQG